MDDSGVKSIFSDYLALLEGPVATQPSSLAAVQRIYPKALLLASASYLEVFTCREIGNLFLEQSAELSQFVFKAALDKRFHSLFDWTSPSATVLFALFGKECAARFKAAVKADADIARTVSAFLEIGGLRNQLVHTNYAEFQMTKTVQEIMDLHSIAAGFPPMIRTFVLNPSTGAEDADG